MFKIIDRFYFNIAGLNDELVVCQPCMFNGGIPKRCPIQK